MISKFKKSMTEVLKDKNLYIFLGITLIFFGIFILPQYATDSYLYFNVSAKELFLHLAELGRLVTAVFWGILSFTNYEVTYIISFIIAIITTTLSMYELNKILKKDIQNEKITILISVLVVINIFILELYMFLEKGIMMLSVLLSILAVGNIDEALKGNKRAFGKILIEMFLANCCYQGTVGIFVALGTIYIIKNSKTIWQFIKNNIIVALGYGLPALLNLLIIKLIFKGDRLENSIPLTQKITSVIEGTRDTFTNTFEIIPHYLFLSIVILIGLVFIIKLFLEKDKKVSKILVNIFFGLYVIAAIVFATSAPQILQSYVYMVPRNVYPFGAMIGILLILMFQKVNVGKVLSSCVILVGIVFISIEFYNFMDITTKHYYTNLKDRDFASKITEVINDYEKNTGNTITKIVFYKQENMPTLYKYSRHNGDTNVRAFYTEWGIRGLMNRFLQREVLVTEDEKNIEYEEIFKSKEWKEYEFDKEQLIFEKNTLHLYIV